MYVSVNADEWTTNDADVSSKKKLQTEAVETAGVDAITVVPTTLLLLLVPFRLPPPFLLQQ
jgi:hypothetical protein